MSKALPIIEREQIIKDRQAGKSIASIAKERQTAYQTVQALCRRYEQEGEAGLKPRYGNCGPQAIKSDLLIYRAAVWLKRLHQKWGAPFIHLKLQQRYAGKEIPSERTFQTWFRKAGLNTPRSKHPKEEKQWASKVHEVWQVDGKEEQLIQDKQAVSWLTIVDEHSGSLIAAPAFAKKEYTVFLSKKSS